MGQRYDSAKIFIDANTLLNDSFLLGRKILASGYEPNLLLALWRGGTPVGIAIQELLAYEKIPHEHFPVKTSHYSGLNERREDIVIGEMGYIMETITSATRLLIIDDVFDTGLTLDKLAGVIRQETPISPSNLKVATLWFKPKNNRTQLRPDYFLHTTNSWVVFPHELQGLEKREILEGKPELPALTDL